MHVHAHQHYRDLHTPRLLYEALLRFRFTPLGGIDRHVDVGHARHAIVLVVRIRRAMTVAVAKTRAALGMWQERCRKLIVPCIFVFCCV